MFTRFIWIPYIGANALSGIVPCAPLAASDVPTILTGPMLDVVPQRSVTLYVVPVMLPLASS
jgi:hypothetical protein